MILAGTFSPTRIYFATTPEVEAVESPPTSPQMSWEWYDKLINYPLVQLSILQARYINPPRTPILDTIYRVPARP